MPQFFGINTGAPNQQVVITSPTTTGRDVEIAINTNANVGDVEDLLQAVERLRQFILQTGKNW